LVSVETYQPAVTRSCFDAGAKILNLTSAENNEEFFHIAAAHDGAVIICYVQGRNVREVVDLDFSADPIGMMHDYFARQIEIAVRCGVEKLFLDPGLGFELGEQLPLGYGRGSFRDARWLRVGARLAVAARREPQPGKKNDRPSPNDLAS